MHKLTSEAWSPKRETLYLCCYVIYYTLMMGPSESVSIVEIPTQTNESPKMSGKYHISNEISTHIKPRGLGIRIGLSRFVRKSPQIFESELDSPAVMNDMDNNNNNNNNNNKDENKIEINDNFPDCKRNYYDNLISDRLANGTLSRPIVTPEGIYKNPFPDWKDKSSADIMKFLASEMSTIGSSKTPSAEEREKELQIITPSFETNKTDTIRFTWIGHSTAVIQIDGFNILTDPIFSDRASFTQYFGPKRIVPPACPISDLPEIDAVIISHNHFDHLDTDSVEALNKRFGDKCTWIAPLGLKSYLKSMSVMNIIELNWWEKTCLIKVSESYLKHLDIYFTPAQHWSRRGFNDRDKTLWGSYTILSKNGSKFFFSGDTGYCDVYKQVNQVFGNFTGAAIPIGAYQPRWFMKQAHIDPSEAIQIHKDLGSNKSVGIHHSTFILSQEHYREPAITIRDKINEMKNTEPDVKPFVTIHHGESLLFPLSSTELEMEGT